MYQKEKTGQAKNINTPKLHKKVVQTAEMRKIMAFYRVSPCKNINGKVKISGSKNASLPILAASLLSEDICEIENVPHLSDTENMCELIRKTGANCTRDAFGKIIINAEKCRMTVAPSELVEKIRASFLIIAPLLIRCGRIKIPLPGGCRIGTRPIDLHLKGFASMGAKIKQGHGFVDIQCEKLSPGKIYLDFPSVGATENLMIAAAKIDGETLIENAATEPEISDLASFLCKMGAKINGAGTDTVLIKGNNSLHGAKHKIIPDRIEAGTFMTMAAICKSKLTLEDVICDHLKPVTAKIKEMGVCVSENKNSLTVFPCEKLKATDIKTLPYPGFPTDMQAQFMALMSVADGTGMVVETIFENRFMQVPELIRMGANIKIDGRCAIIDGAKKLSGAKVNATDLRAGAALVVAALAAKDDTEIGNIEFIERGYENFEQKLSQIGVNIKRTNGAAL